MLWGSAITVMECFTLHPPSPLLGAQRRARPQHPQHHLQQRGGVSVCGAKARKKGGGKAGGGGKARAKPSEPAIEYARHPCLP